MTPQTTSIDIWFTFLAASSTKPMESMEPANAAATIAQEPMAMPLPKNQIITSATKSLAPEEIPSTKGPAIGLEKKV